LVINKCLFTNGYKKLQKLAQNVIPKTLFQKVQEEELRDILSKEVLISKFEELF
jgi:hypothetical protein